MQKCRIIKPSDYQYAPVPRYIKVVEIIYIQLMFYGHWCDLFLKWLFIIVLLPPPKSGKSFLLYETWASVMISTCLFFGLILTVFLKTLDRSFQNKIQVALEVSIGRCSKTYELSRWKEDLLTHDDISMHKYKQKITNKSSGI